MQNGELFPLATDPISYEIVKAGVAPSTFRRYCRTIRSWLTYCKDRELDPIDTSTDEVLRWLDAELRRVNSACHLSVCLAALRMVQRAAGEDREPVPYRARERPRLGFFVRARLREQPDPKRVKPLMLPDLQALLWHVDLEALWPRTGVDLARARELGLKYRAMLTLQWWGALRADDLSRLESVERVPEGLIVRIGKSKTGSATLGLCPVHPDVCPVLAWDKLTFSHPQGIGPITPGQVSRIVKRYVKHAGWPGKYSGHSLRAGFATEAAKQGVPDRLVQRHARWTARTHEIYVRDGRLFEDSPTRYFRFAALDQPNPLLSGPGRPARLSAASLAASPAPQARVDTAPLAEGIVVAPETVPTEQLVLPDFSRE